MAEEPPRDAEETLSAFIRRAAKLSRLSGTRHNDVAGILIKETATHLIYVRRWRGTWRVYTIRKPRPPTYIKADRFWIYEGAPKQAYTAALQAALVWDGADDTEPPGWNRNGQTGEHRLTWEAGQD